MTSIERFTKPFILHNVFSSTVRKATRPKALLRLFFCTITLLTISIQAWIPPCSHISTARRIRILMDASSAVVKEGGVGLHQVCSSDSRRAEEVQMLQKQRDSVPNKNVKATIHSVDWCGSKGMLPLQKYHGHALDPINHCKQSMVVNNNTNMSRSSLYLQQQFKSLSKNEKRRLKKKIQAEARASQPLDRDRDLHVIYKDAHMVVLNKPGGILCVPGPRRNPSLANLAHSEFATPDMHVDRMVVHRLDMDTWGIVVFALQQESLSILHDSFRQRSVKKTYHALVCGHVPVSEGDVDLPLERDPARPPFMRVALPDQSNDKNDNSVLMAHEGFQKFINQAPKPSFTSFHVLSWEYLHGCPVTRVTLIPLTGRTHQLRVHCAAMGHPIVGDDIYGYLGEGAPNAGIGDSLMDALHPSRSSLDLQRRIHAKAECLCLHAQELCIHHPMSGAPMIFSADAPF